MTPEEFLVLPVPDGKAELVCGELRMIPPAGGPHGAATANLVHLLSNHVRERKLGMVFGDGVGYELTALPRTVRVPDASFVRAHRLPAGGVGPGLLKLAPDLAIEVLSPSESETELAEKLSDYRAAGTTLVWVVDPARRTVRVVERMPPERIIREGEDLDGGEAVPGFVWPGRAGVRGHRALAAWRVPIP